MTTDIHKARKFKVRLSCLIVDTTSQPILFASLLFSNRGKLTSFKESIIFKTIIYYYFDLHS